MKRLTTLIILAFTTHLFGQTPKPEDFGFRHFTTLFDKDTVDILVKSKKGDELKKKPLFFFCQGSLPVPLIITEGKEIYGVFPFSIDSLIENFHLVIVSKPGIPLVVESNKLGQSHTYSDPQTGKIPEAYSKRNLLDYYVNRNIEVINFLQKQKFVSSEELIVAGHSQGCNVAAKMAATSDKITRLIYSAGNPLGQIMSMLEQNRLRETDSVQFCEETFKYWESVVADKSNLDDSQGDTYKSMYDFSVPAIDYLQSLKIPVYVCYGTFDVSAPYNDYLRVVTIRLKMKNFTYKTYYGRDHNFFGMKPNGEVDYQNFGWDTVASDWLKWLK